MVDEDLDGSVLRDGGFDEVCGAGGIGEVGSYTGDPVDLGKRTGGPSADDDLPDDGQSDALAGAGDDRDLVGELEIHLWDHPVAAGPGLAAEVADPRGPTADDPQARPC